MAQQLSKLSVEKIMRDPKWIGTSPSGTFWSHDGSTLFFQWNPHKEPSDSLWYITTTDKKPVKATVAQKQVVSPSGNNNYNMLRNAMVTAREGDVFYTDLKTGKTKRITQTIDTETNPQFGFNETKIVYTRSQNLYAWDITSGETLQITNIKSGDATSSQPMGGFQGRGGGGNPTNSSGNQQEQWLKTDQLQYFQVLKERKEKKELADAYTKALPKTKELRSINIEDKNLQGLGISPDGRFVSYRLFKTAAANNARPTIVPNYVTETGFTVDIPARTKVGAQQGTSEYFVYDRLKDTVLIVKTDSIPGIQDMPDYVKDYPKQLEERKKRAVNRSVAVNAISWSPAGTHGVLDIRSLDNKDRWLMLRDTATGKLKLLDRQRDEAWIGGPGIGAFGSGNTGWIDENTFWYRSEVSGYSHIYSINVATGEKKALTTGKYEVQQAQLSKDKKYFYITTNEVHPGEQHFYRLAIADGKKEKITTMTGANQVTISPDEKYLAILYSYSTKPWELYLQENKVGGKIEQITNKAQTEEFRSYPWKDPEVITFTASDGAKVYARLYKPTNPHPNKPAVIFVHGAGYLQNAHKWWSSYFREYMFQ